MTVAEVVAEVVVVQRPAPQRRRRRRQLEWFHRDLPVQVHRRRHLRSSLGCSRHSRWGYLDERCRRCTGLRGAQQLAGGPKARVLVLVVVVLVVAVLVRRREGDRALFFLGRETLPRRPPRRPQT